MLASKDLSDAITDLMVPVDNEADGITHFVDAWDAYFSAASVAGTTCTPGTLTGALMALRGALVGWSQANAAALKIQTAITAFWGVVIPSAATVWVTTPPVTVATPPPTLATIAASLSPVFTANTQGGLSLQDAAKTVASVLHMASLGGTATQAAVPPVVVPIL